MLISFVSILPNLFSEYWLMDVFSNFKPQYLSIIPFLLILVCLLFKNKSLAIVILVIALLWNSYFIVPYYTSSLDKETTSFNSFKLSSINLFSGNSEIELVKKYIEQENPDVLILMELTPKLKKDLLPIIQKFSYKKIETRADNFGIALLSKFEMKSSIDYFDLNNKPSIIGDLNIKNQIFTIVATHPIPPVNQASFMNRNKQLQNILSKRANFSKNLIVVGDLNTSSFSNHFNELIKYHLKDSRIGFGLQPTWPAGYKILQTTLDHCLISHHLKVIERKTGEYLGSDHLPILITIGFN